MKKEARSTLIEYLRNFNYEAENISSVKIKQSNSKPVYRFYFQLAQQSIPMCLVVAKNNNNEYIVNLDISTYNLEKEDLDKLVEQNQQLSKKYEQYLEKSSKTPSPLEQKEKNITRRTQRIIKKI